MLGSKINVYDNVESFYVQANNTVNWNTKASHY